jgi:hypothetical protein
MRILLGVIALLLAAFGSESTYRSVFRPIDQPTSTLRAVAAHFGAFGVQGTYYLRFDRSGRPVLIPAAQRFASTNVARSSGRRSTIQASTFEMRSWGSSRRTCCMNRLGSGDEVIAEMAVDTGAMPHYLAYLLIA